MDNRNSKVIILILLSIVAIFAVDISLPTGYVVYLLYIIPILLSLLHPSKRSAYVVMSGITVLALAVVFMKRVPAVPTVIPVYLVLFNRLVAVACGWIVAVLLERHKSALRQLTESGDEARLIMDAGPTLISYVDKDCRYVRVNRKYEEWFGLTEEQIRGRHIREVLGDEAWHAVQPYIERVLKGETVTYEQKLNLPAYEPCWLHGTYTPDRSKSGQVRGFVINALDIGERKKAEENLLREKNISESAINSMPGVFYLFDKNGKFLRWNRNLEEVTGYSSQEIAGMNPLDFFGEKEKGVIVEAIGRVFTEGKADVEADFLTKSGERIPYYFAGHFIFIDSAPFLIGAGLDITALKQATEKIRQLSHTNRMFLESAGEGIYGLDTEGIVTFINKAGASMLGYEPDELTGKHSHSTWHTRRPDGAPYSPEDCPIYAAYVSGVEHSGEEEFLRKDGTVIPVFFTSRPLFDGEGDKIAGAVVTFIDITERKRAETALRLSEARFRALFEQSPLSIQILSPDGRTLEVNHAYETLWGLNLCSLKDYNILQDKQLTATEIMPYIRKGFAGEGAEMPIVLYDPAETGLPGQPRSVKAFIYPINDEGSGHILQVVLMHVDVTELVDTEKALRESREQLQAVMDNSLAVIYMKDTAGRYLLINRRYEKLFHLSRESVVGKTDHDLFPAETADALRANDKQVLETGRPYEFEESVPEDDGIHAFISIKYPLFGARGVPYAVCGISTDITERKRAEEFRAQAYEKLEAALREKELLLQEIHHRVKNNLQIIFSLLNLQAGLITDPRAQAYFRESQNRVKSMALIHETLYRGQNLMELDFQIYVQDLIRYLHFSHKPASDRITLRLHVENMPLSIDKAIPCGLILTELVSNVFKHAFPEGTGGTLSIEARQEQGGGFIRVADDGKGLPPELDFRHSPSLGLQLVANLADQLEAVLELEPTEKGTSFAMRFKDRRNGRSFR